MSDDRERSEELLGEEIEGNQRRRFGEPLKLIPVLFVLTIIGTLYYIYTVFHCLPLLQFGVEADRVDESQRRLGVIHTCVFQAITVMLIICYSRSVLTHPGEVPDEDEAWQYVPMDGPTAPTNAQPALAETKRSGERRHCKWCGKYKPDRCHHCRVCRTCVLKMDHHCPWIYNCVGYKNYKFFFLLLFYSLLDLQCILWTMGPSTARSLQTDASFQRMFCLLFGTTLTAFLAFFVTSFWLFHVWLVANAMTTIEFCEKSLPKKDEGGGYADNRYNLGVVRNFQEALGSNLLLLLLPLAPPQGGGLVFDFGRGPRGTPRASNDPQESTRGSARRGGKRHAPGGYAGYGAPDESLGMGAAPGGSYGTTDGASRPL